MCSYLCSHDWELMNYPSEVALPHLRKPGQRKRGLESVPIPDLKILLESLSLPEGERISFKPTAKG
jgi:hypothetical protein